MAQLEKTGAALLKSAFVAMLILLSLRPALSHAGRAEVKLVKDSRALYQLPRKGLYAIGAADDGGVITILNGNIHVARVAPKGLSFDDSIKTKTSSLIYTNMSTWAEIPLPKTTRTRSDLHALIDKTLKEFGYENPGTVPFLIRGTVASFKAHVTNGTTRRDVTQTNAPVLVFGFFTKTVKTPPEPPTFISDMHVVRETGKSADKFAGIVDEITFAASGAVNGTTLFLPR